MRRIAAVLAIGIAVAGFFAASASPASYSFTGAPTSPLPAAAALQGWDVQVHSRDAGTWYQTESMVAQHGADCSAPPATHTISGAYQDAVFQCKDHIMTALNAGGYGVIYLTPNQMLDFSSGSATITFELSTLRMSSRDWVDLWITPYDDNLALPFDQGDVDLQGLPKQGVHILMSAFNGNSTFRVNTIQNFVESEVDGCWWCTVEENVNYTPTGAQRERFQLTLSKTHVKFEMLGSATATGVVWADATIPALSFGQGVVQFGHHSYNPAKDNSGVPATWHWDNVTLDPAVPFTITRADRRYVDSSSQTLSFSSPAPAGASLRFAANGSAIQVSTDGGSSWTDARIQPAETNVDRVRSYFTPIPAGTSSVRIRGNATPNGPFFAQDVSLWARNGSSAQPTATPTRTATATPTPAGTGAISGTVTLEGRASSAGIRVVASPGGASATTGANGTFTISGLAVNQAYTLTATAPGFLSARWTGTGLPAGGQSAGTTLLRAGDIDGDGAISIVDVSLVAGLFGLGPGSTSADLNASGLVDIVDVSLTAANFGLAGPTPW